MASAASKFNLGKAGIDSIGKSLFKQASKANAPAAKGIAGQRFKKLLLVCKESKLSRWQKQGVAMSPFVQQNYKQSMEQHHLEHHGVIDSFKGLAERMGKQVVVKVDSEVDLEDMKDVDCVVSLGGDHTFLRASALIWNRMIPILGINTNKDVYTGVLNPHFVDYNKRDQHAEQLLELMEDDHSVSYEKRGRILYEKIRTSEQQEEQKVLCLNEVFCAERDVSSASRYCILKDGLDLGVFKSSGLIVSTGTGSTGWLYGARQLTVKQLEEIQVIMGSLNVDEKTNDQLARNLSEETIFPRTDNRMYFYVREGFSMTRMSEGFCKHIKITSEMLNGQVIVDAWYHRDLSIGDQFTMTASPEYSLRAMELEL